MSSPITAGDGSFCARPYQQGSQEGGASFSTSWDKYSLQESGKKVPYYPAHCPQGDIIASVGEEERQHGQPA